MSVAEDYPNLNTLPAEGQYGGLRGSIETQANQALLEIARLRADNKRLLARETPEVTERSVDLGAELSAIQARLDQIVTLLGAQAEASARAKVKATPKAKRA